MAPGRPARARAALERLLAARARPEPATPTESADRILRLLRQLEHRLAAGDAVQLLPQTARWLSEALGSRVVFVVTSGGGPLRVMGWPSDDAVLAELATLGDAAVKEGSPLHRALAESRPFHAAVVEPGLRLVEPSRTAWPLRSIAVVPLATGSGSSEGALILHSPEPNGIPRRLALLGAEVGARVGLQLANVRLRAALTELEDAQEAARLREELLAALSHDMQTPLAVLLGSVRALQAVDDLAPKHRAGLYESMARRGTQLQRLVEQFLDYSRLEAGRPIQVRPAPTDVAAAVARMEAEVGWRRPLDVDVADGLPPAFVDPDRLDQVLTNLISNAVKFSPVGSPITVRARAGEETVEVAIEDRGQGMSQDELERAFLKFHRGSGAAGVPGTGLGLYVSRAVIEAQGGRLLAQSRPGHGSRFTVVLPRRATDEAEG